MKRKLEMYPYGYIYRGAKTVLIWQTNGIDTFKKDSTNRLLQSHSISSIKRILRSNATKVHWSEYSELDFDRFWTALENLRPDRASSRRTCSLLLGGWNFIEDMGRTFKLERQMKALRSRLLDKAYEKIFYGCNLPATTPQGKSYSPLWTTAEIKSLRTELRRAWQAFIRQGNIRP